MFYCFTLLSETIVTFSRSFSVIQHYSIDRDIDYINKLTSVWPHYHNIITYNLVIYKKIILLYILLYFSGYLGVLEGYFFTFSFLYYVVSLSSDDTPCCPAYFDSGSSQSGCCKKNVAMLDVLIIGRS